MIKPSTFYVYYFIQEGGEEKMKITKVLYSLVALSLLATPVAVLAQAGGGFATVAPFTGTSTGTLVNAITDIVNALLTLAAIVAAIFVIIGGVRYITAQGDEDAVAAAKNTILYAIVGIIVIALSGVIVNFIIRSIP